MWFLKETYLNDLVPFNTTISVDLALSVFYGIAEIREAMVLLENDLFLSKLTLMFDKSRSKGHVRWERAALTFWSSYFLHSICMKRYDGRTKPIPKTRPAKKKGVGSGFSEQFLICDVCTLK